MGLLCVGVLVSLHYARLEFCSDFTQMTVMSSELNKVEKDLASIEASGPLQITKYDLKKYMNTGKIFKLLEKLR